MNKDIEVAIQKDAMRRAANKAARVAKGRADLLARKFIKAFVMSREFERKFKKIIRSTIFEELSNNCWWDSVSSKFWKRFIEKILRNSLKP